jgi:hypothetical protein
LSFARFPAIFVFANDTESLILFWFFVVIVVTDWSFPFGSRPMEGSLVRLWGVVCDHYTPSTITSHGSRGIIELYRDLVATNTGRIRMFSTSGSHRQGVDGSGSLDGICSHWYFHGQSLLRSTTLVD